MRCQHGHCDWTAKLWMILGGRAMKLCTTHSKEYTTKGWILR